MQHHTEIHKYEFEREKIVRSWCVVKDANRIKNKREPLLTKAVQAKDKEKLIANRLMNSRKQKDSRKRMSCEEDIADDKQITPTKADADPLQQTTQICNHYKK